MNIEKLKEAGIAYDMGLQRFSGKSQLYEKFLVKFFHDPLFSQLGELIARQSYEEAFSCAHTLKGVLGNLSINSLYEPVCALVELLRRGEYDGAAPLYEGLIVVYERAKNAVL